MRPARSASVRQIPTEGNRSFVRNSAVYRTQRTVSQIVIVYGVLAHTSRNGVRADSPVINQYAVRRFYLDFQLFVLICGIYEFSARCFRQLCTVDIHLRACNAAAATLVRNSERKRSFLLCRKYRTVFLIVGYIRYNSYKTRVIFFTAFRLDALPYAAVFLLPAAQNIAVTRLCRQSYPLSCR